MAELTKLDPRRFAITFTQPSKTKQSERDACNINSIVAKYNRTGEQPQNMRSVTPQYGDFSAVENLHAALNLVNDSMRSFAELPLTSGITATTIRPSCLSWRQIPSVEKRQ